MKHADSYRKNMSKSSSSSSPERSEDKEIIGDDKPQQIKVRNTENKLQKPAYNKGTLIFISYPNSPSLNGRVDN